MIGGPEQDVSVPDVLGLPFATAARIGDGAGLMVTGLGPDGRGVDADSEAAVVAQEPEPAAPVAVGSRLVLHVGGSAGDRAPVAPPPSEHGGHRDLHDDPDLLPA